MAASREIAATGWDEEKSNLFRLHCGHPGFAAIFPKILEQSRFEEERTAWESPGGT